MDILNVKFLDFLHFRTTPMSVKPTDYVSLNEIATLYELYTDQFTLR